MFRAYLELRRSFSVDTSKSGKKFQILLTVIIAMHFFDVCQRHWMDVNSWDGWAGRFVSAHRPNVTNCLLLLLSFRRPEGGEKKGFSPLSVCVSCFSFPHWSASAKLNKHKRTYVHTDTDTHTHARDPDPVIKKNKKFRAPTLRDQKRKEKAAQTYCCCCLVLLLLLLTFSLSLFYHHHHLLLTGFSACLYDTLKRLFYALTSS